MAGSVRLKKVMSESKAGREVDRETDDAKVGFVGSTHGKWHWHTA